MRDASRLLSSSARARISDHLSNGFHPDRRARVPDIDGEQRTQCLKLGWCNAVIECPPHVGAQSVRYAALSDQGGNDDEAAIPQREFILNPCAAGSVNGFGRHARANDFLEHCHRFRLRHSELARKSGTPTFRSFVFFSHARLPRMRSRGRGTAVRLCGRISLGSLRPF
jgi:hypothetical protein